MITPVLAYHFISKNFITQHSLETTGVGKTLTVKGEIILGLNGMHASRHPADALLYAQDDQTMLCLVEISGNIIEGDDLVCGQSRKILQSFDATKMLRLYAVERAESVLPIFEEFSPVDKRPRAAIEAAKRLALDPSDENRQLMQIAQEAAHTVWRGTDSRADRASRAAGWAARAAAGVATDAAVEAACKATWVVNAAGWAARDKADGAADQPVDGATRAEALLEDRARFKELVTAAFADSRATVTDAVT